MKQLLNSFQFYQPAILLKKQKDFFNLSLDGVNLALTTILIGVDVSASQPGGISYPTTPLILTKNLSLAITPTLYGGTPTNCSSTPPLPAGLSMVPSTCEITGSPTSLSPATSYTFNASNSIGTASTGITISVVDAVVAPASLVYSSNPTLTVDTAITAIVPTISGGTPTTCTASPTLPGGLSLDPSTCTIAGTPYAVQTGRTYTVTASNSAGSTTGSITITVATSATAPTSISFSNSSLSLQYNAAMTTVTPTISGGTPTTCFTIPSLPAGLSISPTGCAISGTPTSYQASTAYNVIAYNSEGYAFTGITITVGVVTYSWGSYTDNFNGTISFTKDPSYAAGRNLLWMKCSYGQTYSGGTCTGSAFNAVFCGSNDSTCDNGTILTAGTSGGSTHAYTACESFNSGSGTYGKTTWRVPTKEELTSLLVCSTGPTTPLIPVNASAGCSGGNLEPAINQSLFPGTVNSDYWSSTVNDSSTGVSIGFRYGSTWTPNKNNALYLRCVSDP